MHRRGSQEPFARHLPRSDLFHMLELQCGQLQLKPEYTSKVTPLLQEYVRFVEAGQLLKLQFTTVQEYLGLLWAAADVLAALDSRLLVYLAAAVSDFYIPPNQLPEHKLQSGECRGGPLELKLQLVPKVLRPLVQERLPKAFTVSFKLETDPKLLLPKAQQALKQYGHQVVVANLLDTRKEEVWIVRGEMEQHVVRGDAREIEEQIVRALALMHTAQRA